MMYSKWSCILGTEYNPPDRSKWLFQSGADILSLLFLYAGLIFFLCVINA